MRLLVVEDDDEMRALMERGLAAEGYRVTAVENGVEALIALGEQAFDLAVVDVMMPGMSGFELARRIREREDPVRILLVTARDAVDDRVRGLELGAEDYLVKPFAFAELLARVRVILRRNAGNAQGQGLAEPTVYELDDLRLDLLKHRATRAGDRLDLTPKEFALLSLLIRRAGEVQSRTVIADQVWEMNFDSETNVVEVAVRRLRTKIDDPYPVKLLHTVRGVGYVLEVRA